MDQIPGARDEAGNGGQGWDDANRSLHDALRISFAILRYAMLVLAVLFLFSGWFYVREGEVAVRCRFGAVLGSPGEQVLKPGGPYFAWPSPIDDVIRVYTTVQRLTLDQPFWFDVPPEDRTKTLDQLGVRYGGLTPGKDGSLLTGDQNIVHAKWTIMFQVRPEDAATFVLNVGSARQTERLVRFASEQGIVQAVARTSADEFIRGQVDRNDIRRRIQRLLDDVHAGLSITEVLLSQPTPPLAVRSAFLEVSQAESEKAQKIEAAEREWSKVHNEVAGAAHRALVLAIDGYEYARRQKDPARAALLAQVTDRLLDGQRADEALQTWLAAERDPAARDRIASCMTGDRVGGRVSQLINEARSYRTQIVSQVRAEADKFRRLLPVYRQTPLLTCDRLWRDARQQILSGDVETFYLPDDGGKSLLLEINRDPAIGKKREQDRYRREMEAKAGASAP